jgi:response regulator RpfG family c-di-GMP phosphodiesterase/putative methionine-R-sulfoxide reductase with GAF domain
MAIPLRVLIIEDTPDDAELMVLHLTKGGFQPEWQRVETEPDFLAALGADPDLILTDWRLPQFGGLRALQLMQERGLDIPFIIVSGSIGEETAIDALRQGACDYVLKDRPARLGQAVQHALESKRLRQERKQAEEQIRFLSRFPGENPYPVFRITPDGILLYANRASEPLLAMWHIGVGLSMPDDWQTWITGTFESGHNKEVEINCGKRLFSCILTPVVDAGYVNVYGRDITKRKKVEKALVRQTEKLRRRNEELARLYRASGSLISGASLNLQELAQKIVAIVQQDFGQADCSLLIVQKDSNELVRLAAAEPYVDQVKYQNLALDGPGLIPRAIRTNKVVNVGDVHSDPDYVQGWDAAQSELAIPLKIGNNAIGAIDIQSSELDAFSPDDERLMAIFAERAALALEHAHLNAQTESRMQQLIALRTVDMAISSSFDINLTLGVLLDQVTGQLGVHAADILIFNAAAQTFNFSCERGFRTQTLRHTRLKFGAGYAWRLIRERQIINIPDIKKGPDGFQRSPDLSGEQFVAYVGIPLIAKGQIKGVLEIFHREPVKFDPEWYRFLELLAGQAAIAIDNAELFDNLQSSNSELSMAYDSTLEGWASALELRDNETEGHTRRATELTTRLAQAMGIKENDMVHIYRGALLHDIGKMGVPDSIVLKPGPLTEDEWVTMRKHPQYAYDMLSPISYLRLALDIPYCHHEKWDGTGYPRGLNGEQIPVAARIFAVVDVWDALTSDRPYRKAWTETQARQYIQEQAGMHFDPEVVKVFMKEVG